VYQPALLSQGSWPAVAKAFALTAIGVVCLAAALIGFVWVPLTWTQRLLLMAAAVPLVFPTRGMELLGLLLAGGTLVWMRTRRIAPCSR
jgi:TRAP-type uncharacterized transport system fused permease subunit